jgi:hypothetical protein
VVTSETFDFKPSTRVKLGNGYLRVTGKAARTGVYQYLASELGLSDLPPNKIVNVYRPESEVFNDESLASYLNADVTNDHPINLVDSKSYRETSVGTVVSAVRDGDFVELEMIIKDDSAIRDVESGKSQLSPGYTALYVKEEGVSPEGISYDYKQQKIDINHVAIVANGRGGYQVRINDKLGVQTMAVMITLDSGRAVDAADPANATLIAEKYCSLQKSLDASMKSEEEQRAKASEKEAAAERAEAKADETEEELEKERAKTSKDSINAIITELMQVRSDAQRIAGDKFSCDSVAVIDNKRAAMVAVNDSVDWPNKSDAYVEARFDTQLESMDAAAATNSHQRLAQDAATTVTKPTSDAAPVLSRSQQYTNKQLGVK